MSVRLACGLVLGGLVLAGPPGAATAQQAPPPDKTLIVVRLPADAKLTIHGDPTMQTGAERHFISPSLAAGKRYRYDLVATWTEGGKERKVEYAVYFRPGETKVVDLNKEAVQAASRGLKKPADKDKPENPATETLPVPKSEGKPDVKDIPEDSATEKLPLPKSEAGKPREEVSAKTRTFEFTYAATVTGLGAKKKARIWLPVAASSADQEVQLLSSEVKGGEGVVKGKISTEPAYGNRIFFAETTPDDQGKIHLKLVCKVTRREVKGQTAVKENATQLARLLKPDALVPITGKPLELIAETELPADPMKKARVLYDTVNGHMKYDKTGIGWGRGDSVWACDSKHGNCSDFHSLFISLARAEKLPAKFEIGFPLPEKRGEGAVAGYHCWAFFRPPGRGWVPVDVSEANKDPRRKDYYFGNLTTDRVTFSTGRDIDLVPRQAGKPINFLIYPHVEVDDREYPQAKIEKHFAFKDLK